MPQTLAQIEILMGISRTSPYVVAQLKHTKFRSLAKNPLPSCYKFQVRYRLFMNHSNSIFAHANVGKIVQCAVVVDGN